MSKKVDYSARYGWILPVSIMIATLFYHYQPDKSVPAAVGASLLIAFLIFLVMQRWFWTILFFLGGLASAFTTLAMIFHFQILGAVGMFVLSAILFVITSAIATGEPLWAR